MSDLKSIWRERQNSVDRHLRALLHEQRDCPPTLAQAMSYSLLAPGKRLRPLLTILSAEAIGGSAEQAMPAACAVEMIHTYSLIHDDLPAMDDDDLRRGKPTCHKQFGDALAILAGDALLTMAFEILAAKYPAQTGMGCCRVLAQSSGACGMVGGQVEDLAWEQSTRLGDDKQTHTLDGLQNIHAHKTGALFRACLQLGVWSVQGEQPNGPDKDLLDRLDQYGTCFGLLFQITDDLLDVESTTEQLGKRAQKDAERGKLTYPGFLGVQESRTRAAELVRQGQSFLHPLQPKGRHLADLLQFVLQRDR